MSSVFLDLANGDMIAIRYRTWIDDAGVRVPAERWIRALVIDSEPGAWPIARLADGQLTEVRPFMTWRMVGKISPARSHPLAA